ncbi:hypothetical protein GCM10011351_29450 [Paraliobacillus quinghaiensis]|uniref:DUF4190 domain-containing protein n=1 Tax=Paraliobacillus quinghaiensis TaxID=470815 RepID=A0A917WYJ6_9BACI|nr:DUF4190 domain-containing protein [Paraliobacillus quinghaiensis]GGM41382.1 hypothetical protein GCM10011351_29450 [Paraliobacillus quinghaiensis]
MGNVEIASDVSNQVNKKVTVSLVLGILSILTSLISIGLILGIIGLIFGIIGMKQMKRSGFNDRKKVIIAIISCVLGIFITLLISITAGTLLLS